jgi:hypothetical protein
MSRCSEGGIGLSVVLDIANLVYANALFKAAVGKRIWPESLGELPSDKPKGMIMIPSTVERAPGSTGQASNRRIAAETAESVRWHATHREFIEMQTSSGRTSGRSRRKFGWRSG